jgi:hypothetical protein
MTLEFTQNQQVLLSDALHTRLQRIAQMIRLFEEDRDAGARRMIEAYSKEYIDVEYLLHMVDRGNEAPKSQSRESLQEKAYKHRS